MKKNGHGLGFTGVVVSTIALVRSRFRVLLGCFGPCWALDTLVRWFSSCPEGSAVRFGGRGSVDSPRLATRFKWYIGRAASCDECILGQWIATDDLGPHCCPTGTSLEGCFAFGGEHL